MVLIKRFIAFWIDCIFMFIIGTVIHTYFTGGYAGVKDVLILFLGFFAYLILRDVLLINGSLGKKIVGLKIISEKKQKNANPIQILFRNITLVLGVFDALVMLTKGKRLGDMLCGTLVVECQKKGDRKNA